jgi:ABC-type Mn2+/Zn2+ transport system ATPase subunit
MNQATQSVLAVEDLLVGFSRTPLLPPISFEVHARETWAIAGPNGAGKSTLLRTLLGLLPPVGGSFRKPGRVGYVPQRSQQVGGMPGRVVDVVTGGLDEGLSFMRMGHLRKRRAAVEDALALTHCQELRKERFSELSEGQKQRVLIARAIVRSPELLILDEPTSAMDIAAEHRILHLLDDIRRDAGIAVLLVSHHLAVVAEFATHLVVLDRDLWSVVAGPLDVAGADPAVQKRYGRLFLDAERHTDSDYTVDHG